MCIADAHRQCGGIRNVARALAISHGHRRVARRAQVHQHALRAFNQLVGQRRYAHRRARAARRNRHRHRLAIDVQHRIGRARIGQRDCDVRRRCASAQGHRVHQRAPFIDRLCIADAHQRCVADVVFVVDRTGRTWRTHHRIGRCADAQGQVFGNFVDAVLFGCDGDRRCGGAARRDFHIKAGAEQGRNRRRIGYGDNGTVDVGVAHAGHVRWTDRAGQADMDGYIKATCCCLSDVIHQVIS